MDDGQLITDNQSQAMIYKFLCGIRSFPHQPIRYRGKITTVYINQTNHTWQEFP
jgi:hypothetical protein